MSDKMEKVLGWGMALIVTGLIIILFSGCANTQYKIGLSDLEKERYLACER